MELIIKIVSERTGVPHEQITSTHRSKESVMARRLCSAIMRKHTLLTLQEIATELNLNNHTTVMYYITTHDNYMSYDCKYTRLYDSIESTYKSRRVIGYTLSEEGSLYGFFAHYDSAYASAHGRVIVPILNSNT
jgi:hypothetical protein